MKKLFYVVSLFTLVAVGCALGDPVVLSERLAGYARLSDIPTNVSELTNDEGYVNQAEASDLAKVVVNEMAADGWDVGSSRYQLVVQAVPSAKTTFTLAGGVEEVVDISGTLDRQWMIDNGYYDGDAGQWTKFITRADIGTSVTSIGASAFYDCSGLTSVTIGDSATSIGNFAFYNCSGLMSVTIGESVASIGQNAFSSCTNLTSVTIPDSVADIGRVAFASCTSLASVTIGNGVTNIGEQAFTHCGDLASVVIPDGVTSLGLGAFYYCTNLTSVIMGDSVTSIGGNAFRGCSRLTSMAIPDSVTSIGGAVFYSCPSLMSVDMSGRTASTVRHMSDYSWDLPSGCVITCSGGETITIP